MGLYLADFPVHASEKVNQLVHEKREEEC